MAQGSRMIAATGVSIDRGAQRIVDNVDLHFPPEHHEPNAGHPSVTGLVGPNGCGKTTLLKGLLGELPCAEGSVTIDGEPLARLSRRTIAQQFAIVVQEDSTSIPMTVADLVTLGRIPHNSAPLSAGGFRGERRRREERIIVEALTAVGLRDKATHELARLSGGERQRARIARAVAQRTPHLIMDEPTNHLDIRFQHDVLRLVQELSSTRRVASLIVLHDLNLAARYCDYVYVMDAGRIVAAGAPREVLTPEVLEPIYGIPITRVDVGGNPQLLFGEGGEAAP
ncbi:MULTISPECIES: ABC transporter ATP-binding protein [Corynebacterium]|uniref:ABC transporter ATP-binding protein n=1 Tax=Corynebacterium TaxID=1716 RepID=UPI001CE3F993|nr:MULTISPECIES: ABC transporter ATP-binding protein [Corynebacterium]